MRPAYLFQILLVFSIVSGVQRARSTVHNWVQIANLQLISGKSPNHIAVNKTVSQLNDRRFWLYAVIDPKTNAFLHVRLFPTRTIILTKQFLQELHENYDVADAVFLVDDTPWLQAAPFEENLQFQHETQGNRNTVERVFKEVRRRTEQFANPAEIGGFHFRHTSAESAETWLQTFAFVWNQLI